MKSSPGDGAVARHADLPFDAIALRNSGRAMLDALENVTTVSSENLVLKMILLRCCCRGGGRLEEEAGRPHASPCLAFPLSPRLGQLHMWHFSREYSSQHPRITMRFL